MIERKRLQLIVAAVKYCKRVRKMGMPSIGYTKALREPVHYLWERRVGAPPHKTSGPKICAARFRSEKAKGVAFGKRKLVYDHAIPFSLLQDKLLALTEVTCSSVKRVLEDFCVTALITHNEAKLLRKQHLEKKMPEGWDGVDPLARYRAVGIKRVKNKFYSDCAAARRRSKC